MHRKAGSNASMTKRNRIRLYPIGGRGLNPTGQPPISHPMSPLFIEASGVSTRTGWCDSATHGHCLRRLLSRLLAALRLLRVRMLVSIPLLAWWETSLLCILTHGNVIIVSVSTPSVLCCFNLFKSFLLEDGKAIFLLTRVTLNNG